MQSLFRLHNILFESPTTTGAIIDYPNTARWLWIRESKRTSLALRNAPARITNACKEGALRAIPSIEETEIYCSRRWFVRFIEKKGFHYPEVIDLKQPGMEPPVSRFWGFGPIEKNGRQLLERLDEDDREWMLNSIADRRELIQSLGQGPLLTYLYGLSKECQLPMSLCAEQHLGLHLLWINGLPACHLIACKKIL